MHCIRLGTPGGRAERVNKQNGPRGGQIRVTAGVTSRGSSYGRNRRGYGPKTCSDLRKVRDYASDGAQKTGPEPPRTGWLPGPSGRNSLLGAVRAVRGLLGCQRRPDCVRVDGVAVAGGGNLHPALSQLLGERGFGQL